MKFDPSQDSPLEKIKGEIIEEQKKRETEIDKMLIRMKGDTQDEYPSVDLFGPQAALRAKEYVAKTMQPVWAQYEKDFKKEESLRDKTQLDLSELAKELRKATSHLDEDYLPFFWQVLIQYGKDEEKMDIMDTYKIAVGAEGILDAFEKNYKEMYQRIGDGEDLSDAEMKKLAKDIRPLAADGQPLGMLETMRRSGPWTVVGAMNEKQLYDFTKKFIQEKPDQAQKFVRGMVASNRMNLVTAKKLWNEDWGDYPLEELRAAQNETEKYLKEEEKQVKKQRDDTNQMVAFMRPKNLAGVALQTWGFIEGLLNGATMLYRKDWKGFVSNEYFLGGIAAFAGGRSLTHKGSALAFLKEKAASVKEQEQDAANKGEIGMLMLRYEDQYSAIDRGALMHLIKERRENGEDLNITLQDLRTEMMKKNQKNPKASYEKKLEKLASIDVPNNPDKLQMERMLTRIAETRFLNSADDLNDLFEETLEANDLTKTDSLGKSGSFEKQNQNI